MRRRSEPPRTRDLLPRGTAFLLCDVQERVRGVIDQMPRVIEAAKSMCEASKVMSIPLIVSASGNRLKKLFEI